MASDDWNERHITDVAQRILNQIVPRGLDRGRDVVDSATFVTLALWSLLLWESKGRRALIQLGVDSFDLAREIDQLLDRAKRPPVTSDSAIFLAVPQNDIDRMQRMKAATPFEPLLQQAEHEALELGHTFVSTEHLLLAIVRMADPTLAAVLGRYGVTHSRVREAVLELFRPRKFPWQR